MKDIIIEKNKTMITIMMRQHLTSGLRSRAFQFTKTMASRVAMRPKIEVEAPTEESSGLQRELNRLPPMLI